MRILICNERFLFRFGLDRVLITIAKGMKERGHEVYMMGNRCDEKIIKQIVEDFIAVPNAPDDYANSDKFVAQWVRTQWNSLFSPSLQPDIVITGGWPFFEAIEFFRQVCKQVIFIDAGAVPLDGFSGHDLFIQQKLRNLRRQYLHQATTILPISEFIATSQSIPDRGTSQGVQTILLAANHMELSIWKAQMVGQKKSDGKSLSILNNLEKAGKHCILNLGRWEPNCYKNSPGCFDVMRQLLRFHPQTVLLVLADVQNIDIPADLKECVIPLGFPDDAELQEIMKRITLGISVSLWEGFNLPLAEMQWLQKPALVFNLAAHPEVVVHPWFLCNDTAEMVSKANNVLSGSIPAQASSIENYNKFRTNFRWEVALQKYYDYLENAQEANQYSSYQSDFTNNPLLVVDVTNSSRDPANSGVIRVTRQLCRTLQKYYDPVFVVWDFTQERYVLPSIEGYAQLGQFNGPSIPLVAEDILKRLGTISLDEFLKVEPSIQGRNVLLLLAETILDTRSAKAVAYAKQNQWKTAAIFYDLIPVIHPQFCSNAVSSMFPPYLEMLSGIDIIIPISEFSAQCLLDWHKDKNLQPTEVKTALLPGQFGKDERNVKKPNLESSTVQMLCVSTLEPRKNHLTLLKACDILAKEHPEIDWQLTLVGNRYEGAKEIYKAVEQAAAKDFRIRWLGIVDDATLNRLYEEATFTIYSSLVEGFGMPILESIWYGRVCLCHSQGVMAELASDGGCMVVDMTDASAIAEAIYTLSTDKALLAQLSQAACNRQLKTWDEYGLEVLVNLGLQQIARQNQSPDSNMKFDVLNWEDLLYPHCLLNRWQMHDSERMALTGILARHQPKCSVEVGTYYGGSLSLISQYSNMVFSIDIDSEVPLRLPPMENVSFLTGKSQTILPLLFQALDEANIAIDFLLIDGDHSADGVRRDVEIVLGYVPKQPMFVMIHDSFNPGCRHGIMSANWQNSPHVAWVEVDFVPGRVIEGEDNAAKGEMWGGLALALLLPTSRDGELIINASASSFYDLAVNSRG
ncbi:glycosyltransferase [Rivularia sp. UHCC 0363]|uniref:glycosyltransferase n=1 Tax=Rivularia sp. UHCC 0363 TaxID=3110244 RepID=UPI002B2064C3|nr:glycosyltransferase [Rivularia sp. UHCC 0363]MEA5597536.1 glycosyltransferase [Rivularia sp. UHCC 0363]